MPVKRIGVASPPAFTGVATLLATADTTGVASVIVTNRGNTALTCTIYVEPFDSPGDPTAWSYVVDNLLVDVGQSFESFRFALTVGDKIFVSSSTPNGGFTASLAYEQEGRSNVSYQPIQPGFPDVGDIWIDSINQSVNVYTGTGFNTVSTTAPVGPVGPTGPQGDLGATGPTGPASIIGPQTVVNADDPGNPGTIYWDFEYIYVCVEENTWKRVEISSWT
jgi:hypothetical protein